MAELRQEIAEVAPFANTDEQGTYTGDVCPEDDD